MAQASLTSPTRAGRASATRRVSRRTHADGGGGGDAADKKYMETIQSIKRWLMAIIVIIFLFIVGLLYILGWLAIEWVRLQQGA